MKKAITIVAHSFLYCTAFLIGFLVKDLIQAIMLGLGVAILGILFTYILD